MYLTSTSKHSIPPLQRRFNTILYALFKSVDTIMPGKIYTFSMDLDGSVLLECKSHSQILKYSFLGGRGEVIFRQVWQLNSLEGVILYHM